jgi:hypothetical protein
VGIKKYGLRYEMIKMRVRWLKSKMYFTIERLHFIDYDILILGKWNIKIEIYLVLFL